MHKIVMVAISAILLLGTGCASEEPTLVPPSTRPRPTATLTPPALPTVPVQPSASLAPSSPTVASTVALSTATPRPSPNQVPPGLYVTNVRVDPDPPTRGTELTFQVTFLNTTQTIQNYKWLVYIYRPDVPNRSLSETTATSSGIPVAFSEVRSLGYWRLALGGPCENFVLRVAWLDQNNKATIFARPDGQVYEKTITVCAASDLPTFTPAPPPLPTPTPTFAPGLFAMDLRTDPSPPVRGSELTFYVTIANTAGTPQNLKWIVYIFKPGERNSYGETSATTSAFAVGINEYKSAGFWKLPLGGPCENYVARVGWFDNENRVRMFTTFDNQVFEKSLTICP